MTISHGNARRAQRADLDSVLELDRSESVGHVHSELLTTRVESGGVIIVERDDRLSGFVVLSARSFFGFDFVELLRVAGSDRRQGVGSYLIAESVHQSSTDRVFTSTNASNAPMIGLLAKAAWRLSGQLEGIDDGDPELVYFIDAR